MLDELNQGLSQGLYQLSNVFLFPVMAAVASLFAAMSVALGGLIREWLERSRVSRGLHDALQLAETSLGADNVWQTLQRIDVGLPRRLTAGLRDLPDRATLESRVRELEHDVAVRLALLGFVARVGPMLGLLGTLIPFGPALAGLSAGDVRELSANLVTAFATTVVGLLCGCLGFAMALVRKTWYSRDLDFLELIARSLITGGSDDPSETKAVGFRT